MHACMGREVGGTDQAEEARAGVGDAELNGAQHVLLNGKIGRAEAGHQEGVGGRSLRQKAKWVMASGRNDDS